MRKEIKIANYANGEGMRKHGIAFASLAMPFRIFRIIFLFSIFYFLFSSSAAHAATTTIFLIDAASTTWTVPSDWSNLNTIEVIGGGGGGDTGTGTTGNAGGGGGAYARVDNVTTLVPGMTVGISIGFGGNTWEPFASTPTWLCKATSNCTTYTDSNVVVSADAGASASGATAGTGGTTNGSGTVEFAGGDGGIGNSTGNDTSGGGGGAGSPNGVGGTGGAGDSNGGGQEAHGGGGASGDDSDTTDNGAGGLADGGAGGDSNGNANSGGIGGADASGTAGTDGGGGGGGDETTTADYDGGRGGDGQEWDSTHGAGGGGGGASEASSLSVGGDGGLYGGGGGGGFGGGNGAQGIIVIKYTPPGSIYEQSAYKWYANNNSSTPGTELTAGVQDASTTLSVAGSAFRLRMLLHVGTATSTPGTDTFKLQYASTTPNSCNASFYSSTAFVDVGTSSGEMRYNDNAGPTDGDIVITTSTDLTHGGDSKVNQTYEEVNNFTVTSTISVNADGKWDFSLIDAAAAADTTYCFRVVKSDGSFIATSTSSKIPEIRTAAAPPAVLTQDHYQWFANADQLTPTSTLALQNTSTTDVASGTVIRLRMNVAASSTGSTLAAGERFKLQFATSSGASTWTDVGNTASTTIWRTYDNTSASTTEGATIPYTLIPESNQVESYEEANPSTGTPNALIVTLTVTGQDWTQATSGANWEKRRGHTSLVYNNQMWVIGGNRSTSTYNDVWYSTNGITWTRATSGAAWVPRFRYTSLVYDNKMWVIGGSNNVGSNLKDIWYSTNGITWTQATSGAQWSARNGHTSVVYDNKMWVMGGTTSTQMNDVWYSTNGIAWTMATSSAAWGKRTGHTSLVFNNKMWVMGGSSSTYMNDVWYSTDGITWTQATSGAAWQKRNQHTSLVFNNKIWVMGGASSTQMNDVWSSAGNGEGEFDWTLQHNGAAGNTPYYFRMAESDGSALDAYNNYPMLTTAVAGGGPAAPTVSSVTLNHGNPLILTPNTTTSFDINYTVADTNGCTDVVQTTSTAFRGGVSSTCAIGSPTTNNLNCYLFITHTTSSCVGNLFNATDTVGIYYFAQSTGDASSSFPSDHWYAYASAIDLSNATGTDTSPAVDVQVLTAINVTTSSVNYGSVSAGTNTGGVNQVTVVQNAGNSSSTVKVYGTALTYIGNLIATSSQHFATSSFTFGGFEQVLSNIATTISGVFFTSPTSTTHIESSIFWGIEVLGGRPTGTYTGVNTFMESFSQ